MSEAPQLSPFERAMRAKTREIETHRSAIIRHGNAAALCFSLGREGLAKVAKERAARARVMLETAITEAEAFGLLDPLAITEDEAFGLLDQQGQPLAGTDSGPDGA